MKKISLLIVLSLLFSHQVTRPLDGVLNSAVKITVSAAKITASAVKDAATSNFAILVYQGTCISVATLTAKTLIEPLLAQYRRATNSENSNEMLARVQALKEFQQLDANDFQIQIAKIKVLKDNFGDYQVTMQKRLQVIKESDASEEEKQRLILKHENRLKTTEENITKYNTEEFEELARSTNDKLEAHLRKQVRTS